MNIIVERVVCPPADVQRELKPLMEKWMVKACTAVQRRASELCPVDTGRLRASIDYQIVEEGGEVVGYVGSEVEYALFVEAGTWKMAARPWLVPALDAIASVT